MAGSVGDKIGTISKYGALVLIAGAAATGLSCCGLTDPGLVAAAGFGSGVLGNAGFAGFQSAYAAWRERTGALEDENHTILRTLREAQLRALEQLHRRWNDTRPSEPAGAPANGFAYSFTVFIEQQRKLLSTLTWDQLPEPLSGGVTAYLPAAFDAALAARHGVGPQLDDIQAVLDASVVAELDAALGSMPESFRHVVEARDTGFYAHFVSEAAAALRQDEAFARIWNGEQVAVLGHLATGTLGIVSDMSAVVEASSAALRRQGEAIETILGRFSAVERTVGDIGRALLDESNWLHFDIPVSTQGWLRFTFYNPAIPFQGRSAELQALNAFLDDPRGFAWWAATGPGGTGKTRLALELCWRAHARGWCVGFLRTGDGKTRAELPGSAWRPSRPTLIVADYAAEHVSEVSELAQVLSRLPGGAAVPPVRLLMLERQFGEPFWRSFLPASAIPQGLLKDTQYPSGAEQPPRLLRLPDLSDDELWSLVRLRPWQPPGSRAPLTMARNAFFARLLELDRGRRPLVAMLLADAPDLTGDLTDVLRELLWREHAHWHASLPNQARVVIAAATMLGTLEGDALAAVEGALKLHISGAGMLHPCARAIGAALSDRRSLDALQPDLIGEFFVLELLRPVPPDANIHAWLPPLCWRVLPERMAAFVLRSIGNFPRHPGVGCLIEAPMGILEVAEVFLQMAWAVSTLEPGRGAWQVQKQLADRARDVPVALHVAPAVRESLAAVLMNTLTHAGSHDDLARRDALLQDLRALAAVWREDAAVREPLSMGLFNTLNAAKAEGDLGRRDALLGELCALSGAWPKDAAVRERLAMGLFNTLNAAKAEGDLGRRDALLGELCALSGAWPKDAAVRERLAMGLFNTLNDAKAERDPGRRDALLGELCALAGAWPEDAVVRKQLAMGLFNTLNAAEAEGDPGRRAALLGELRALSGAWPEDAAVREQLAMGLLNTLSDAKAEGDPGRRDALLGELLALSGAWPEDAAVRQRLAMGLFNTLIDAKAEGDPGRRDALLGELRALAGAWPEDAAVRQPLAMGLFSTLNDAKAEGDLGRRDALLGELRALAVKWPEDSSLRKVFCRVLGSLMLDAMGEGVPERADLHLAELRRVAASWPGDMEVQRLAGAVERLRLGAGGSS